MIRAVSVAAIAPRAVNVGRAAPQPASAYPEVPLVLTGAFSLYLLVWFLEFNLRVPSLGAIRFEFLLGAALAVAAVVSIAMREEDNLSSLTKYICLYFAFLVGHLAITQYFDASWKAFVDWIAKFACITLFTYAFVRSPRGLRIFVAMLLLSFAKVGEEALLGKLTGTMVWENQGVMRLNGAPGSRYGHPNSLSAYAVCMLPFIYYLFPVVNRKWKPCLIALLVLAVNMIVFTASRTGYLATIALAAFLWKKSTAKMRVLTALALVAAIGIPLVPAQYHERFMTSFTGEEAEGHSKESRIEVATDAWTLFLENPQGLGIYAFMSARVDKLGKGAADTHNMYLQILADLGVLGVFAFGALVFGLFRELRTADKMLARNEEQLVEASRGSPESAARVGAHLNDVRFMRATVLAFSAYLFTRLVLALFGHDLYEVYWWLTAGASIAVINMAPITTAKTAALVGSSLPAPKPASSRPRFALGRARDAAR